MSVELVTILDEGDIPQTRIPLLTLTMPGVIHRLTTRNDLHSKHSIQSMMRL
jgi:hypothetical protein